MAEYWQGFGSISILILPISPIKIRPETPKNQAHKMPGMWRHTAGESRWREDGASVSGPPVARGGPARDARGRGVSGIWRACLAGVVTRGAVSCGSHVAAVEARSGVSLRVYSDVTSLAGVTSISG